MSATESIAERLFTTDAAEPLLEIPPALLARFDELISHYPVSKRSATMMLLHEWQEHFGYISELAIVWIATKLELQPINVLEVVTFYPMYRRKPAGRHHIRVCRTLSCCLAGSKGLMEKICDATGIDRSESGHHSPIAVGPDGRFSVEFVECLASCGTGPVCMVNDDFFEAVQPDNVAELLKGYE